MAETMGRWISGLLIRLLGTRRYLRIPQRLRRRLGLVCGEDMSDINALLRELREASRKKDRTHA